MGGGLLNPPAAVMAVAEPPRSQVARRDAVCRPLFPDGCVLHPRRERQRSAYFGKFVMKEQHFSKRRVSKSRPPLALFSARHGTRVCYERALVKSHSRRADGNERVRSQ